MRFEAVYNMGVPVHLQGGGNRGSAWGSTCSCKQGGGWGNRGGAPHAAAGRVHAVHEGSDALMHPGRVN